MGHDPFGDLLRAPGSTPAPVLPSPVPPLLPGHQWSGRRSSTRRDNQTGEPFLNVGPQGCVRRQLRALRTTCRPLGVPLRRRRAPHPASPHSVAALVRSSMPPARADGPPLARPALPPAAARSPRAQQTRDSALKAASQIVPGATAPSPLPDGTTESPPAAIHRPPSPRPHLSVPQPPTPRTDADAPAAPQVDAPATAACPAASDLNGADPPSHHPPTRCCDD